MVSESDRAEGSAAAAAAASTDLEKRAENERLARIDQHSEEHQGDLKPTEELEMGETLEDEELLPQQSEKPEPAQSTIAATLLWTSINTLATIGIVSRLHSGNVCLGTTSLTNAYS